MPTKALPSGSRAALVLALLVLAAIITGVAASAAATVIPKQLTGDWSQNQYGGFSVGSRGNVEIPDFIVYHARFSRVTKHRLSISRKAFSSKTVPGSPSLWSCSGTGTYRWTIANHGDVIHEPGHQLTLKKIHDACKERVDFFAGKWFKPA